MLLTPHWVFDDYTAVTPDFLRVRRRAILDAEGRDFR